MLSGKSTIRVVNTVLQEKRGRKGKFKPGEDDAVTYLMEPIGDPYGPRLYPIQLPRGDGCRCIGAGASDEASFGRFDWHLARLGRLLGARGPGCTDKPYL